MAKTLSSEEFAERLLNRVAVGVALVAFAQLMDLLHEYTAGGVARTFDLFSTGAGLLAMAVVLPSLVQKIRRRAQATGDTDPEGFIAEVYKTAAERAFAATFIGLTVLAILLSREIVTVSASIAVEMVTCLSLTAFSFFFYLKNRQGIIHEEDDFS